MNAAEWIKFLESRLVSLDEICYPRMFVDRCLQALKGKTVACATAFVERLNRYPLHCDASAKDIVKGWDTPGHPIRDFLIVLDIDYPEPEEPVKKKRLKS